MTLIGRIAKASRAFTQEVGKRKRGQLVKGEGRILGSIISSPLPAYEKFLCLCVGNSDVMKFPLHQENSDVIKYPRKWYMLHLSSDKDKCKEEEERNGEHVVRIPTPEHRGSYLAFHHDERHRGQGENPRVLPLIMKLKDYGKVGYDTSFAVVGSSIYLFGGGCSKSWSRKVTYFDASRPEDGWNRGPRTICERTDAAMAALHGKLYIFGGCKPHPNVWAEVLDTNSIDLEADGKGKATAKWSPLPDCSGLLGFEGLFAVALDDGKYSGNILVGSKSKGAICLYDVTHDVWKTLGANIYFGVCSNPIVVGTTIYWIKLDEHQIGAYDIVRRSEFSMPLGDFKISELLGQSEWSRGITCLNLVHLAGDIFCMLWVEGYNHLHCTVLRICTTILDTYVLCCHSYSFDHPMELLGLVPVQPYMWGRNADDGGGDGC